jgi:hypothetical protein
MYLARANAIPVPTGESQGLILLRQEEVQRVAAGNVRFGEYCASGGRAVAREPFPETLVLEPFLQLRALALLLTMHPTLGASSLT